MNEAPEQAINSIVGKSRNVIVEGIEYPFMKDACL